MLTGCLEVAEYFATLFPPCLTQRVLDTCTFVNVTPYVQYGCNKYYIYLYSALKLP